jgi:hypothetical protein
MNNPIVSDGNLTMRPRVLHLFHVVSDGEWVTVTSIDCAMCRPSEMNTYVGFLHGLQRFPESIHVEETFHDMNRLTSAIHISSAVWIILEAILDDSFRRKV